MRVYDWNEKLAEGKAGEEVVLRWFADTHRDARIDDVRENRLYQAQDIDFVVGETSYEIKTDMRAHETGNLFLEFEALEKSKADYWLFYVPQRGWLFQFYRENLQKLALEHWADTRTVRSDINGKPWMATGVPIRMSELLFHLEATLYTGITTEDAA